MSAPDKTPPRILCVDDRVSSLDVRRALLKQMGYDVLIASDPPTALAIVEKVAVDLVVLDYSFPGQISGDELARQLRKKQPKLPLIMLSGYPDLPDGVADSVDILLLKGAGQPTELLNSIAKLLKRSGRAGDHTEVDPDSLRRRNQDLVEHSRELLARSKSHLHNNKR